MTPTFDQSETTSQPLIKAVSIGALLNARDAIVERIAQAHALLGEADEICERSGFQRVSEIVNDMASSERDGFCRATDKLKAKLDASAWNHLMKESGLFTFFDRKARQEWQAKIHEAKTPELNADNIEATFVGLYEQRGELFERGVLQVFRRLNWNYKTNSPFAFGKRLIITGLISHSCYLDHGTCNELDDLLRVMSRLDGKPEPDHRDGVWRSISQAQNDRAEKWAGEYFELRWYKNGNGHLTFTRLDLVEGLNAILAKHYPGALPKGR